MKSTRHLGADLLPQCTHYFENSDLIDNAFYREDLIIELHDVKRRYRALEETTSQVKAENQRLEFEATKQQRRIDQLLNLADGAKNIGISSDIRRDIEKSILVRQLKNQINNLRDDYAEKEAELDALRRNIKSTHLTELENDRDEYYLEVQRLKGALLEVKDELHRERQRREWNTRVAGDTSDDLRKEVARLSSGYQNILTNISNRSTGAAAGGNRPATSTGTRGSAATPEAASAHANRPVSATATSSSHAAAPTPKEADRAERPDRPKRPLSATSRNTPLSTYYQGDGGVTNQMSPGGTAAGSHAQTYSDPLDNFGLPGTAVPPSSGGHSLRAHLHDAVAVDASTAADSGIFKIGDRVQGQFQGGSNWYHGAIQSYNAVEGTYAVRYDDGDYEADVPLDRLRASSAAVEVVPVKANVAIPTLAPAPASHPALMGGAQNFVKPKPQPAPVAAPLLPSPYKVGDKIEALYYKGTTWYGGKVQAVHAIPNPADGEYAFDIAYDDGDRELKVPQANVRFPAGSAAAATAASTPKQATTARSETSAPASPSKSDQAPPLFKVGDIVEGFYGGGPSWYGAKVSKVNPVAAGGKHTYVLDYNDGDREVAVAEVNIRLSAKSPQASTTTSAAVEKVPSPAFKMGDRVQGFFPEYDAWYDGSVQAANSDGTYHVRYDDGDEDSAAAASQLRTAPHSAKPASPAKAAPVVSATVNAKFKVDDRVEGKFGNGEDWYPAVISSVQKTGSTFVYSLDYNDGDHEDAVIESLIRAQSPRSPPRQTAAPASADNSATKSDQHISPARRPSVVNTNLDSFLNDLSDDESTGGGLDAGKGMMLQQGGAIEEAPHRAATEDEGEGYDEDFDA